MLRRSLKIVLAVVALASLCGDADAGNHRQRGAVADYLIGGYGYGPFGHGDYTYAGSTSHTATRHRQLVPSFTTGPRLFR